MAYSGASVDVPRRSSEFGSGRGGWADAGNIVRENMPVTNSAVDAVINVGANQAAGVTVQLNHADGSAIAHVQDFELYVVTKDGSGNINGLATTGGSTGIAIASGGASVSGFISNTVTAKKIFKAFTTVAGLAKFTWTDNASEAAYLAVRLPNGRLVLSAALPIT